MDAAEPRLQHSSVVAAAKSDAATNAAHKSITEFNKIRTSDGMFFARGESPLVQGVVEGSNTLRCSMLAAAAAAGAVESRNALRRSMLAAAPDMTTRLSLTVSVCVKEWSGCCCCDSGMGGKRWQQQLQVLTMLCCVVLWSPQMLAQRLSSALPTGHCCLWKMARGCRCCATRTDRSMSLIG